MSDESPPESAMKAAITLALQIDQTWHERKCVVAEDLANALAAFAAEAVAVERAACAQICEDEAREERHRTTWKARLGIAAMLIRARAKEFCK